MKKLTKKQREIVSIAIAEAKKEVFDDFKKNMPCITWEEFDKLKAKHLKEKQ